MGTMGCVSSGRGNVLMIQSMLGLGQTSITAPVVVVLCDDTDIYAAKVRGYSDLERKLAGQKTPDQVRCIAGHPLKKKHKRKPITAGVAIVLV